MAPTLFASDRPQWNREGRDWPHRAYSQFIEAGGLRWHVQILGRGPAVVLVHGTGAASHSWRGLAPLLARDFQVIVPDLPGHGFTETPDHRQLSLPGMAKALHALLTELDAAPELVIGHSAGAAILMRMCLEDYIAPRGVVSVNGALLALTGLSGQFYGPVAKFASRTSFVPRLFALQASNGRVIERLIRDTGSRIDPAGMELYARLARKPGHTSAALGMMANWDLAPLERDLSRISVPVLLLVGDRDRTISPNQAAVVERRIASADVVKLRGFGHLVHEEAPEEVADAVRRFSRDIGLKIGASCGAGLG